MDSEDRCPKLQQDIDQMESWIEGWQMESHQDVAHNAGFWENIGEAGNGISGPKNERWPDKSIQNYESHRYGRPFFSLPWKEYQKGGYQFKLHN